MKLMEQSQGNRCGVRINYSRCKGCGKCYDICPSDIFGFDPRTKLITVEYPYECMYCGACVMECPVEGTIELDLPMVCL